jgi:hypothetical protein
MRVFHSLCILFLIGCAKKPPADYIKYANTPTTEIQINPIPHPLNIDGMLPYVVWIDGKRANLNPREVRKLALSLDLPLNVRGTPEMHAGAGWLEPHNLTKK